MNIQLVRIFVFFAKLINFDSAGGVLIGFQERSLPRLLHVIESSPSCCKYRITECCKTSLIDCFELKNVVTSWRWLFEVIVSKTRIVDAWN